MRHKQHANPFSQYPYLCIFYMLPKGKVEQAGYREFPRNPWEVISSPKWRKVYHDSYFQLFLSRSLSAYIWPEFKLPGDYSDYSHNHPLKAFASDYDIWARVLEKLGYTTELLASMPKNIYLHYIHPQASKILASSALGWFMLYAADDGYDVNAVVKLYKKQADLCDFKNKYCWKYQQVHQRYYHTRPSESKYPKLPPYYPDIVWMWQESKAISYDVRNFTATLDGKDRRIGRLLALKYTQEEIAAFLGYSNHSGVLKRARRIKEAAQRFDDTMTPRVFRGKVLPPRVPTEEIAEMERKRAYEAYREMPVCKRINHYWHLEEPCATTGKLALKYWDSDGDFFTFWNFEDGRKIAAYTPTLDFAGIRSGATMSLVLQLDEDGIAYLASATPCPIR